MFELSGMSIAVTCPSVPSRFRMMFCVISQVARRTHSHQVLRAHILRLVVQMRHRQRSPVCIERFARFPALLSAHLAFPFGFPFHIVRYGFPMYRIQLFIHRHRGHLPFRSTLALLCQMRSHSQEMVWDLYQLL